MKLNEFEKRNLIFESKWKTIVLLFGSLILVLLALNIEKIQSNFYAFWCNIILFGSGVIMSLFRLLNPKNLFLAPNAKLTKIYHKLKVKETQKELGVFSYTTNGFIVKIDNKNKTVKWHEIISMTAYKKDKYTYEDIYIDILLLDKSIFSINEETKGWLQFLVRTKTEFSTINQFWENKILLPAFETNRTLIYHKNNIVK